MAVYSYPSSAQFVFPQASGGGGGTPGGSDTQLQYNNSGSFGGLSSVTWNSTKDRLVINTPSNSSQLQFGATGFLNRYNDEIAISSQTEFINGLWLRVNGNAGSAVYMPTSGDFNIVLSDAGTIGANATLKIPFKIAADSTIYMKDVTSNGASEGYVWTLQNPATGEAAWQVVSGGSGATTALDNLVTTNVNETLNMQSDKTVLLKNNIPLQGLTNDEGQNVPLIRAGNNPNPQIVVGDDATTGYSIDISNNYHNPYTNNYSGTFEIGAQNVLIIGDGNGQAARLKLYDGVTGDGVTIQAPNTEITVPYSLTLPTNAGTNGQVLSTNGSGVLSWISAGGGGGVAVYPNAPELPTPSSNFDLGITADNGNLYVYLQEFDTWRAFANLQAGTLYDVSSNVSISAHTRYLFDPNGTTVLDWSGTNTLELIGTPYIVNNMPLKSRTNNNSSDVPLIRAGNNANPQVVIGDDSTTGYAIDINGSYHNPYTTDYGGTFEIGAQSVLIIGDGNGQAPGLQMWDGVGSDAITIQAPNSAVTAYTLTLPSTPGSAGQSLKTDGSGNLYWG